MAKVVSKSSLSIKGIADIGDNKFLIEVEDCPEPVNLLKLAKDFNKNLTLADRVWACECGEVLNRDENAAINIRNVGLSMV